MKALVLERNVARFAAARVVSAISGSGRGAGVGPLRLVDVEPPELPGPDWHRVDVRSLPGSAARTSPPSTAAARATSRTSSASPSSPGTRSWASSPTEVEPTTASSSSPCIGCVARGDLPRVRPCAEGRTGGCERVAFGHLSPGLQIGYCADTGGGWSAAGLVAHESQLHAVPDELTDEEAVMVEPTACAVHAALAAEAGRRRVVAVLGAGTLGLAHGRGPAPPQSARHADRGRPATPHQRRLAESSVPTSPSPGRAGAGGAAAALARSRRRRGLTGGADAVVDCVGIAESIGPGPVASWSRRAGSCSPACPGTCRVDLAGLWHREVALVGAYAYGIERRRSVGIAAHLRPGIRARGGAGLGRLVSATYPLERYEEALAHAGAAGRRGAVKIAFDLRRRPRSPTGGSRHRARKGHASMSPRPGFVLDVDRSTPPTLFWHGEGYRLERLPVGRAGSSTRPSPSTASPTPSAPSAAPSSSRWATRRRCRSCCSPACSLTIAFDDISLPLPPMQRPDVRQLVIEQVLDMAAAAGVDDVVLDRRAGAASPDDRGRAAPRARGPRSTTRSLPTACYPARRRGPRQPRPPRSDRPGRGRRDQQAGGYLGPARLRQHQPRRHGRRPQVAWPPGLASYRSLRHHHNARTMQSSRRFMDQHRSELHSSNWRMGRLIAESGVKVFQIETTLNTNTFPEQFRFLQRREWEWTLADRAAFAGLVEGARAHTRPRRATDLPVDPRTAADDLGAGRRGRGGAQAAPPRTSTRSSSSRSTGRPTSSPWACPTSARTTSTRS